MRFTLFLPSLMLLFFLPGCKVYRMNSLPKDREIMIDGSDSEWESAKASFEKEKVSIGFYNDMKFLYLCLVPLDRSTLAAILDEGLTVWFDPKGGNEKTFGIGFPTGMRERGIVLQAPGQGADGAEMERFQKSFDFFQDEMELLIPGKSVVKWESLRGVPGVEVKAGFLNGRFAYELKVPLTADNGRFAYAVEADTGHVISVGFETPESEGDMDIRPGPGTGSPAAGGGGEGGRGSRGGRGGSRSGGVSQEVAAEQPSPGFGYHAGPEPVKIWIQLHLAKTDFK
jgi:hypothetical protein